MSWEKMQRQGINPLDSKSIQIALTQGEWKEIIQGVSFGRLEEIIAGCHPAHQETIRRIYENRYS